MPTAPKCTKFRANRATAMKSTRYAAVALDTTTDAPASSHSYCLNTSRIIFTAFAIAVFSLAFLREDFIPAANQIGVFGALLFITTPTQQPRQPREAPLDAAALATHKCDWQLSSLPAHYCRNENEASSPTFEAHEIDAPLLCPETAYSQICSHGNIRALLVGPFYSAPGEWHSIVARYDELLQPSDRVIGVTSDAVDASTGHAVPYPPLHLHHIHIQRSPAAHWYETHGDYDLISPKDGYYRGLPDGYCDYNEESAKRIVTTQINDVRYQADAAMSFNVHATSSASNRSKGPTLKWYLRLVLRLHGSNTQSRCKPVTKYIFWYKALFTSMDLTAPSTHPPLLSSHTTHY